MISYICDRPGCGKTAQQKESQYKRKKRHFCSMKCYAIFKRDFLPIEEHPRWEGGVSLEEARRRWYQNNKIKVAAMAKERRMREALADGGHTEQEWQAKLAEHNGECAYKDDGTHECSGPITKEHTVPLIMGGSDSIDNIKPACGRYNSKKWKRVALVFDKQ